MVLPLIQLILGWIYRLPSCLFVELAERLAETIRRHRQQEGMNQRDMARRLGISQPTLARLEGGAQNVNLKIIEKLCRSLRCDVGELFSGRVRRSRHSSNP